MSDTFYRQVIKTEEYDYVIDKGALTGVVAGATADKFAAISSLRIFGMKKGSCEFLGFPGHYLINTAGESVDDLSSMSCFQMLEAPCLVHFADEGNVAEIALEWKFMNEKLYAITIPTDVWISNSDPDKDGKWVSERDATPKKLSVLSYITKIQNRNGQPLETNFNRWIKDHSPHFKDLKIASLADTRAWCQYQQFERNVALVSELAHRDIVMEVTGTLEKEASKKGSKNSNAECALTDAQKVLLDKRKSVLSEAIAQLTLHVQRMAVPLSQRCLELDVQPNDGGESITPKLIQLSAGCTSEQSTKLYSLVSKAPKLSLVMDGKGSVPFACSPMKHEVEAPAVLQNDSVQPVGEGDSSTGNKENDCEDVSLGSAYPKRARKQVSRLDAELSLASNNVNKKTKTTATNSKSNMPRVTLFLDTPDLSAEHPAEPKKRGPYKKTGLYSRDPLKAVQARQAARAKESPKLNNLGKSQKFEF